MKRLLTLFAILALSFTLAACGGGTSDEEADYGNEPIDLGPSMNTTQGIAVDPYLVGAVFEEVDQSGNVLQTSTTTDAQGRFIFADSIRERSRIQLKTIANVTHAGQPYNGVNLYSYGALAKDGTLVVSPVSTLISNIIGSTHEDEEVDPVDVALGEAESILASAGITIPLEDLMGDPLQDYTLENSDKVAAHMAIGVWMQAKELHSARMEYAKMARAEVEALNKAVDALDNTFTTAAMTEIQTHINTLLNSDVQDAFRVDATNMLTAAVIAANDLVRPQIANPNATTDADLIGEVISYTLMQNFYETRTEFVDFYDKLRQSNPKLPYLGQPDVEEPPAGGEETVDPITGLPIFSDPEDRKSGQLYFRGGCIYCHSGNGELRSPTSTVNGGDVTNAPTSVISNALVAVEKMVWMYKSMPLSEQAVSQLAAFLVNSEYPTFESRLMDTFDYASFLFGWDSTGYLIDDLDPEGLTITRISKSYWESGARWLPVKFDYSLIDTPYGAEANIVGNILRLDASDGRQWDLTLSNPNGVKRTVDITYGGATFTLKSPKILFDEKSWSFVLQGKAIVFEDGSSAAFITSNAGIYTDAQGNESSFTYYPAPQSVTVFGLHLDGEFVFPAADFTDTQAKVIRIDHNLQMGPLVVETVTIQ